MGSSCQAAISFKDFAFVDASFIADACFVITD
jgi:hypothetical protein